MPSLSHRDLLAKLPADELKASLDIFLQPVNELLPDRRLRAVTALLTQGIVTSQSPLITQIARGSARRDETIWPTTKRGYRFLANARFTHRTLLKGLYHLAQRTVSAQPSEYVVIAVDPVNFEKPYTQDLEGLSRVLKATPPCLGHPKRVTRGFPALTATIVNRPQPATTCARWFSYATPEFLSQNREIERAFRVSRALFPRENLRFGGDAGLTTKRSLPSSSASTPSLSFGPATTGSWKSTMIGSSVGDPARCSTSRQPCPCNSNRTCSSRTLARSGSCESESAGFTFVCSKRAKCCGSWLLTIARQATLCICRATSKWI